jgi:flagellar biosynthesis regulator FlaF
VNKQKTKADRSGPRNAQSEKIYVVSLIAIALFILKMCSAMIRKEST